MQQTARHTQLRYLTIVGTVYTCCLVYLPTTWQTFIVLDKLGHSLGH